METDIAKRAEAPKKPNATSAPKFFENQPPRL